MIGYPFLFYGLIGIFVAFLLGRKGLATSGAGKHLALASALFAGLVGVVALFVFATQGFDLPGPGIIMIPSTLISIACWTAGLIWAGPATAEDHRVFIGTLILAVLMFLSGPLLG